MGLNIKNTEVEQLVSQVAAELGVNKTEAVRRLFEEKSKSLGLPIKKKNHDSFHAFLEEMWKKHPSIKGKKYTKADYDAIFE